MPFTLSPSSLSLFKDCPRCFWLQVVKKVRRPEAPFPSLPSGMDKVLKAHFDAFRKKGQLPPELKQLDVSLFDNEELLAVWRNNRKGIQWRDEKDNVVRGAVDIILQKGKKLIVLDFKTRGFPLKEDTHEYYKDQLNLYNLLLRKNGYDTEDYSYLLFYHPKEVLGTGEVVFHNDLIRLPVDTARASRLVKDALKVLEGTIPPLSKDCGFCSWAGQQESL